MSLQQSLVEVTPQKHQAPESSSSLNIKHFFKELDISELLKVTAKIHGTPGHR